MGNGTPVTFAPVNIDAAKVISGVLANARVNWAAPSAIGTGTPAAITGTTVTGNTALVSPIYAPASDGTTAMQFTKADKSTAIAQIDTTNGRLARGIGTAAAAQLLDLYDGNLRFTQLAAPGAATAALVSSAGNLFNGAYKYQITFVTFAGETIGGTTSNTVTCSAGNQQIALSGIPTGPAGTTGRKIYRTIVNGSSFLLLATINDNTTTTFTDNIADGSLGAVVSTANSTGGSFFVGATKAMAIDQNGYVYPQVQILAPAGSASIPSYSFVASKTAGMWLTGTTLVISASQNNDFTISSGGGVVFGTTTFTIQQRGTANPTLSLKAAASQTGDLQQWQTSAGAVLLSVNVNGAVAIKDTNTAAIINVTTLLHSLTTINAGATNIGTGLVFAAADSTSAIGAGTNIGRVRAWETNATHASLTTQGAISGYYVTSGVVTEVDALDWGVNSSGAPLLGLFAVTPIARPTTAIAAATFVANTSGTLNDSATWSGYTIGQVVKALQNVGVLT